MTSPCAGWIPVDIQTPSHLAFLTDAPVRWIQIGTAPLSDPFLDNTLTRLRAEQPPVREIDTDLKTLLRMGNRLPPVRPAGFIFHISRCGSTLIANALKTSPRACVLSESRLISKLIRREPSSVPPYLREKWNQNRRKLLESIFSIYAPYRTGTTEPVVIKFASINTPSIAAVRAYWPDVPCLISIRDPLEVIVANMQGTKGFMAMKERPEICGEVFGFENLPRPVTEMMSEEFAARVVGRFLEYATATFDSSCKVMDYGQINVERARSIAQWFGVELDEDDSKLREVFRVYTKDPNRVVEFQDDRAMKQKMATVMARSAANMWAASGYDALRGRTKWT